MDALSATPSDTAGPPPDPEPGGQIGRFELVRAVGRGGFGVVYLARDPRLGREVAVKTPRPDVLLTSELLKRFAREGKAAAGLDHAHIVPVYETGEDGPVPYIVSAYIPGQSLAGWLKETNRPVAPRVAARLTAALADAVQHAHERGVLHRDLKPANVLLDTGGADPLARPRLTDFGLARLAENSGPGETAPLTCLGTPSYMAPEQAFGRSSEAGPAADVYGLGAILYELLTGRPPFQGATDLETRHLVLSADPVSPRRTRRDIPTDLETVCLKCLEKDLRRRYLTAADLAADLRRVLRGEPTVARPPGPVRRLAAAAHRRPQTAAFICLILVGLVSAAATLGAVAAYLAAANDQLNEKNRQLLVEKNETQKKNRLIREQSYGRQVRHVAQLLRLNHRGEAAEALRQLLPEPGEEDQRGFAWRYLARQAATGGRPLVGHTGAVHGVAFSPDGHRLASGGKDHTVRVWDVAAGVEVACLRGATDEVNGVAFSPDGGTVAAGSDDGIVRLWPAAGGVGRVLGSAGAIVDEVLFSDDGRHLAATDRRGRVYVWEVATDRLVKQHQFPQQDVLALGRARTADLTVTAVGDGQATLTDLLTGAVLATDPAPPMFVKVVAPAADGFWAAWGDDTGRIEIRRPHSTDTYRSVRRFLPELTGRSESLARSADRQYLACGLRDSAVLLFDLRDRRTDLPVVLRGHDGRVWGLAFTPDGQTLATAGGDGAIRIWDVPDEIAAARPYATDTPVADVAFVPGTHRLVVACDDGPVKLLDLPSRRELVRWQPVGESVNGLAVAPDGRSVFAALTRGGFVRLTLPDLKPTVSGRVGEATIVAVATVAGGRVVTADSRGQLAVGPDDQVPQPRATFSDGGSHTNVAVVPGTGLVATRAVGGDVVVWDAVSGEVVRRLAAHTQSVEALAFSVDGRLLATGSIDKTVRVWDWRAGQRVQTLAAAHGPIRSLAFTPDGRTLIAGGDDQAVRLWRPDTGLELLTLDDHPGPVRRVAFSSDGRLLVAAGRSADGKGFITVRDAGPP